MARKTNAANLTDDLPLREMKTYEVFILELMETAQKYGVEFKLDKDSITFIYGREREVLTRAKYQDNGYWVGYTPDPFYRAEVDWNERTLHEIVLKKVREVLTKEEMTALDRYYGVSRLVPGSVNANDSYR